MLAAYPEFAARPPRPLATDGRLSPVYVQVETDDKLTGLFRPIFAETIPFIRATLAPYLLDQDPLAGERLWDVLYRQDRHARTGNRMLAFSAVDCALWDLRGFRGTALVLPVCRLLGGPTRKRIDCDASMLGDSLGHGSVRQHAHRAAM